MFCPTSVAAEIKVFVFAYLWARASCVSVAVHAVVAMLNNSCFWDFVWTEIFFVWFWDFLSSVWDFSLSGS